MLSYISIVGKMEGEMRTLAALAILALLSAPAFAGEGQMAVQPGFGATPPVEAERFDNAPPIPRPKPQDDVLRYEDGTPIPETWEEMRQLQPPDVRREWDEYRADPEGYMDRAYREHFDKMEQQQRLQKMMEPRPSEVDI